VLTPTLDASVRALLVQLKEWQDRVYAAHGADKGRLKRRIVVGLREVRRDVLVDKAKLVIVAPDIRASPTPGSLDAKVAEICALAGERNVDVVFALGMYALGHVVKKPHAACVAVLNWASAEPLLATVRDECPGVCWQCKLGELRTTA
jgi:ribosomal protein L7Ae-like RNA K-turn-binding protein